MQKLHSALLLTLQEHEEGHVIFYDFLGWFMIFYTETTGIIINVVVCVIALAAIGVSLFFMSARSGLSWPAVLRRYGITFAIQILSLALASGLTILIAVFMDGVGRPMTWFSELWLIVGLYFCPMFFGMGILPALYLERTKNVRIFILSVNQQYSDVIFFWLLSGFAQFGFSYTTFYALALSMLNCYDHNLDVVECTFIIYVHDGGIF